MSIDKAPLSERPAAAGDAALVRAARRRLLRHVLGGGALGTATALPVKWVRPVVDAVLLPAHAVASCLPETRVFNASGSFAVPAGVTVI